MQCEMIAWSKKQLELGQIRTQALSGTEGAKQLCVILGPKNAHILSGNHKQLLMAFLKLFKSFDMKNVHWNGVAIINESQKDAYSENFIKIRPQTAKLGVGTVPRPKLDFCCSILAQIYAGLEF